MFDDQLFQIMSHTDMISAQVTVNATIEKVWKLWNNPEDIKNWNNTDESWLNLKVENDLRPGGKFLFAMAKKDGSEHFDFEGAYNEVKTNELITYTLTDGRKTILTFEGNIPVTITETFDPEPNLPHEMQKNFCQAVLEVFKKYAEAN